MFPENDTGNLACTFWVKAFVVEPPIKTTLLLKVDNADASVSLRISIEYMIVVKDKGNMSIN